MKYLLEEAQQLSEQIPDYRGERFQFVDKDQFVKAAMRVVKRYPYTSAIEKDEMIIWIDPADAAPFEDWLYQQGFKYS